jgi:hypothetical protein
MEPIQPCIDQTRTTVTGEYLRCSELLNPEELTHSKTHIDFPKKSDQKPVLQLCLGLPSSSKSKSRLGNDLLKDASSFGQPRNHGIPYLRKQRQIRREPEAAKKRISTLLQLPQHLIVSDKPVLGD